jgi:hypothetical protein
VLLSNKKKIILQIFYLISLDTPYFLDNFCRSNFEYALPLKFFNFHLFLFSPNIIGSRAENHLIFKRALKHDSKIVLCAPAEGVRN